MQIQYLRLVCRSDEYDYPMYLDAPIETNKEGSFILIKSVLCGFFGDLAGTLNPFVLRKEDTDTPSHLPYSIDFGTDFEGRDRQYTTNLPSKSISKGTQFTICMYYNDLGSHKEHIYKVRDIIAPLRQKAIDSL